MRKGLTLVELLVVLAIVGIISALLLGACNTTSSLGEEVTFVAQVKDKYPFQTSHSDQTVFRVEVLKENSSIIDTLENVDDFWNSKHNSATIQANLIVGNWYRFTVRGERNEAYSLFPNIYEIVPVQSPLSPEAEPKPIDLFDEETGDIDL